MDEKPEKPEDELPSEIPPFLDDLKSLLMHVQYRTGQQDPGEQIKRALKLYLNVFELDSQGYKFGIFKLEPGKGIEIHQVVEDWEF